MIGLTLMLLATLQDRPTAPVVTARTPPPPVFVSTPPRVTMAALHGHDLPAVPLLIEIQAGDDVLWTDTLRVGFLGQSSYSATRNEPPEEPCETGRDRSSRQDSLRASFNFRHGPEGGDQLQANVHWTRPVGDAACRRGGSRSVSIELVIDLPPGKIGRIEGDGGLVVIVRRP